MTNAIFDAEYADFKNVKTRSVAQFVFEVPIEKANQIIQMIGLPNAGEPQWFGIARLNNGADVVPAQPAVPEGVPMPSPATSRKEMSYAQRAGMLCNDEQFWEFLKVADNVSATDKLREQLQIASRTEIDGDPEKMHAFNALYNTFDVWRKYGGVER